MNLHTARWLAFFVVLALAFGAGWKVEAWRKGIEIADLKADHQADQARAAQVSLARLADARRQGEALVAQVAAAENARDTAHQEKNDALRRLTTGRPCLSGAAVRLLNEPARQPGAVPPAAGQPVAAAAAFATDTDVGLWAAAARRAYDTCRGRLAAIASFYEEGSPVTDDIDRAQAREEEMRQDALAEQARRAQPAAGDSALDCAMCGEPIPEGRRLAMPGTRTCIECQTDIERAGLADWGMAE